MTLVWRGLLLCVLTSGLLIGCGSDEGADAPTQEDTISAIQKATGQAASDAQKAAEEGSQAAQEGMEKMQDTMEETAEGN